ncbi:MAG: M28 family peptidase [Flavobacteriales bacterium]|jgi:hypothetical protein|nr:M28 family peptidase [Flavobacteriales bacterium]NCG29143.1 M28 family peptidase [Bacteroidota bacterium]MBT3963190.1 M28 family peptidase [Flavobacteriales bacterium]MBT4705840.1 M28 family peptidase [Flavobacteriales bacterium]MBT4931596.1 M28 family peptidase [Flavobacteriales bacterium]
MGFGRITKLLLGIFSLTMIASCGDGDRKIEPPAEKKAPKPKIELVKTPVFNPDSAYAFVEQQVGFGPRVPNTLPHVACAKWLETELQRHGLATRIQEARVTAFNGDELKIYNIMASYRPDLKDRILLCAHWDTRPFADRDTKHKTKAIDGANDGASGVGVLLEIAHAIGSDTGNAPKIGFDIVFFDAEDYGKPLSSMIGESNDSWCLGSQYWSRNIPVPNYNPRYGILLDMVGAKDAIFPKEWASLQLAPEQTKKIWAIGRAMGHTNQFLNIAGNQITDDHIYLNTIAKIPTVDIIHYEMANSDFGSFHHTHADNMDVIDPEMLGIVGEVVMQVIYQE